MSLLDDFARTCTLLEKTRTSDGEGGYYTTWTDGTTFENYQALNTSNEAIAAEQQGANRTYYALVNQAVPIEYYDYFRDETTGDTYRVTTHPEDKVSPGSATFNLKYFEAIRSNLPT